MGWDVNDTIALVVFSIALFFTFPIVIIAGYQLYAYWNSQFILKRRRYLMLLLYCSLCFQSLFELQFYAFASLIRMDIGISSLYTITYILCLGNRFFCPALFLLRVYLLYFDYEFNRILCSKQWQIFLNPEFVQQNWFLLHRNRKWGDYKYILKRIIFPVIFVFYVVFIAVYLTLFTPGSHIIPLGFTFVNLMVTMVIALHFWRKFPKIQDIWYIRREFVLSLKIIVCSPILCATIVLLLSLGVDDVGRPTMHMMIFLELLFGSLIYAVIVYPKQKTEHMRNINKSHKHAFATETVVNNPTKTESMQTTTAAMTPKQCQTAAGVMNNTSAAVPLSMAPVSSLSLSDMVSDEAAQSIKSTYSPSPRVNINIHSALSKATKSFSFSNPSTNTNTSASPSTSPDSGVFIRYYSWQSIVQTVHGFQCFGNFLQSEFSTENLLFVTEFVQLKNAMMEGNSGLEFVLLHKLKLKFTVKISDSAPQSLISKEFLARLRSLETQRKKKQKKPEMKSSKKSNSYCSSISTKMKRERAYQQMEHGVIDIDIDEMGVGMDSDSDGNDRPRALKLKLQLNESETKTAADIADKTAGAAALQMAAIMDAQRNESAFGLAPNTNDEEIWLAIHVSLHTLFVKYIDPLTASLEVNISSAVRKELIQYFRVHGNFQLDRIQSVLVRMEDAVMEVSDMMHDSYRRFRRSPVFQEIVKELD